MDFSARCKQVAKANPVKEFAQELFDEGWTEGRLVQALKQQPFATDPFKINLQNYLRDFIIGVDIS